MLRSTQERNGIKVMPIINLYKKHSISGIFQQITLLTKHYPFNITKQAGGLNEDILRDTM